MESVLGRYRNLIILVGVLFLQFLGLAVQVKRSADAENTRLIRIWAVSAITPLERGLVWVQSGAGNLWHNYVYLRGVRAENRQLKEQIEQMRLQQVRLNEDAAQARRLQALLAFKEQFVSKTVAAQVIGSSGSDLSRIIYIDKGENAHLERDMAVVTADGIVGKVLFVYPSVSQVLLINDQSSGVGAILEKTRLQGVVKGTANGEVALERVMSDEQIAPGDTVLTSGGDRVFPKGLPVGTVTRVGTGKDLFLNVRIRPAANLSKLEEVLVVTEKQERQAAAQDMERMRAADILAQRLPSVPDKPVTPEKNAVAGSASGSTAGTKSAVPQSKPAPGANPQAGSTTRTPSPTGSTKPSGVGIVPGGTAASTPTQAGSQATGTSNKRGETVEGQPAPNGVSKPVAPKSSSDPAAAAKTGTSKDAAVGSKPADSQPKSPEVPKPAPPESNPQPPAVEDSPQ
jgi:rod shape-determining protein MreC